MNTVYHHKLALATDAVTHELRSMFNGVDAALASLNTGNVMSTYGLLPEAIVRDALQREADTLALAIRKVESATRKWTRHQPGRDEQVRKHGKAEAKAERAAAADAEAEAAAEKWATHQANSELPREVRGWRTAAEADAEAKAAYDRYVAEPSVLD